MTTEELQNSLFNGLDQLSAENKLNHISTQLIARYSGVSEAAMLRHVSSVDKVVAKWLKIKESELKDFFDICPNTNEMLLAHINKLIKKSNLVTLIVSTTLDETLETESLKKLRKSIKRSLTSAISQLDNLPDRNPEELTNELFFFFKSIIESSDTEALRKKSSLAKNFPWNAEEALFPSEEILQRLAISESGFVFDPVSGRSFTINECAMSILRILQKTTNIGEISNIITQEYEISLPEAERDILEFAGRLRGVLQ